MDNVSVAIVGAGPYGLTIAAHLRKADVSFRIFGKPMQNWSERMPKGMLLKSEGFASSLYDPDHAFTLRLFCAENGLPYEDVGAPVTGETFVAYGQEFQRRLVPNLEPIDIEFIDRTKNGFRLKTASGDVLEAARVVMAVGITHFAYVPPVLATLPSSHLSHSLDHHDLSVFKGRSVAVVGGGASAVDFAGLLHEAGAQACLIARRNAIAFHSPTREPRSLRQRLLMPRSGLGLGWRSRMCTVAPLVFHRLPRRLRHRAVERHLGPAPGWFAREKVEGRVPMHLGSAIRAASMHGDQVALHLQTREGEHTVEADHIIAATGFRIDLSRLTMLAEPIRAALRVEDGSPALSRNFESSVSGLYFVGLASANAFGPLARFAYGAKFTGKHLGRHLAAAARSAGQVRALDTAKSAAAASVKL